MRLIDADALKKDISGAKKLGIEAVAYYIDQQPTAVVRCGECKHWKVYKNDCRWGLCEKHDIDHPCHDDWFCDKGKARVQK